MTGFFTGVVGQDDPVPSPSPSPSPSDPTDGPFTTPFDIAIATTITSSPDLNTIGGGAGTSKLLFSQDPINKKFFIRQSTAPDDRLYQYTYTDLSNLGSGITYNGTFDLTTIDASLDDPDASAYSDDGMYLYVKNGSDIISLSLSDPYVFTTGAAVVDSITIAQIAANSNRNYTSLVGFGIAGNTLFVTARIGNTGSVYYLATATLAGAGVLTGLFINEVFNGSSWIPTPGVTLADDDPGTCNPVDEIMYLFDGTPSPDDIVGYDNFALLPDVIQVNPPLGSSGMKLTPGGGAMLVYNSSSRIVSVLGTLV